MPHELDRHGARALHEQGARFVDVLPAGEYAESHLPGAVNLPLKELDRQRAAVLDPAEPVVVYCHDSR